MKGVESSTKVLELGAIERRGKNGRGVDPHAKIERPAHGPMSEGAVMIMANLTVSSASTLTPSPTL